MRRTLFISTTTIALALTLTSCEQPEAEQPDLPTPLVLTCETFAFEAEEGYVWSAAQEIGVFVQESNTGETVEDYDNVKYFADNRATTGYMVPSEGTPIYLPDDNKRVDIRAYHPYKDNSQLVQTDDRRFLFPIDLSDQPKARADALLYSAIAGNVYATANKARLQLKPVLCKIRFQPVCTNGLDSLRLANATATLHGFAVQSRFDLQNGTFEPQTGDMQLAPHKRIVNEQLYWDFTLIPEALTDRHRLQLALPAGDNGEAPIEANWQLNELLLRTSPNIQYYILLKTTPDGHITAELTGQSSIYIQDWDEGDNVTGTVNKQEN